MDKNTACDYALFEVEDFCVCFPSVLTEKIEELGDGLRSHFNIEEFSPVSLPAQVQICYCSEKPEAFGTSWMSYSFNLIFYSGKVLC